MICFVLSDSDSGLIQQKNSAHDAIWRYLEITRNWQFEIPWNFFFRRLKSWHPGQFWVIFSQNLHISRFGAHFDQKDPKRAQIFVSPRKLYDAYQSRNHKECILKNWAPFVEWFRSNRPLKFEFNPFCHFGKSIWEVHT